MREMARITTFAAIAALCGATLANCAAQQEKTSAAADVTLAPRSSAAVAANVIDPAKEPALSADEKLQLIRRRIKYVFVLFQENSAAAVVQRCPH